MIKKDIRIWYRVFFALLGLSAVVTEIAVTIERDTFNPANFFSYFTIESNLIAIAVLLVSAFAVTTKKESHTITLLRGWSTANMILVGVVFSILLAGLDARLTAVPWDNIVLHYIMPIIVVFDWLLFRPQNQISLKHGLLWMIFPVVYVLYSLVRGAVTAWYPYPFLNPTEHGYGKVAIVCLVITIGLGIVVYGLVKWTHVRKR